MASDDDMRFAPSRKRGWQGEELELEHNRTQKDTAAFAAVDLKQFHNTQVGQGYQAKHVVRQPQQQNDKDKHVTGLSTEAKNELNKDTERREKNSSSRKKSKRDKRKSREEERLQKYLSCSALRDFVKELNKYRD